MAAHPAIGSDEFEARQALPTLVNSLENFNGVFQFQVENLHHGKGIISKTVASL
jgi:hypothetical protein